MKIAFFFESVFPKYDASSIRAFYFIESFIDSKKNDDELFVITGTKKPENKNNVIFCSVSSEKNQAKVGFVKRAFYELWMGIKGIFKLKKIRPALFFISSPSYLASIILAHYAQFKKIPYIFEVRDIYPEAYEYAGLLKKEHWIYKLLSRLSHKAYLNSELVVCATKGIEEKVRQQNIVNVINIYNGFPKSLLNCNTEKYDRFTLVFHGTMGVFQDIELLIRLADELKNDDIDILVIGHGRKAELVSTAQKKYKNLMYLGSLSHSKTLDIVSRCHLGLSFRFDDPLSEISFPVKNWEYLGLAIPSLLTPKGSEAGDFLEKNQCGVQYESARLQDIAESVRKYKTRGQDYLDLIDGCKKVRELYTREAYATKLTRYIYTQFSNNSGCS